MYKGDSIKTSTVGEGVLGCFQRHTHRVNRAPHCCTECLNSRFLPVISMICAETSTRPRNERGRKKQKTEKREGKVDLPQFSGTVAS